MKTFPIELMKKLCGRCNFPLGAPVFRLMLIHHVENGLRIISIMLPCSTLLSTMQRGEIISEREFLLTMIFFIVDPLKRQKLQI